MLPVLASGLAFALKGVFGYAAKLLISYLPVIVLQAFFDALDEIMKTFLENGEKKAKETPEFKDDRRFALYRKYWEGFMAYKNGQPSPSESSDKPKP